MKIGFTGAGGVGKSSVLTLLRDSCDLPILPSPTRIVWARRGLTESDQDSMTPKDRLELQLEIFQERLSMEKRPEYASGFISDRTLIDNMAYCVIRNFSTLDDGLYEHYRMMAFENIRTYDQVFYFPLIRWSGVDDGLRQVGDAYNFVVDAVISSLLEVSGVEYHIVPIASPGERADFVMTAIGSKT